MGESGELEILKKCRKIAFPLFGTGTSPESKITAAQDLPQFHSPPCPIPEVRPQERCTEV